MVTINGSKLQGNSSIVLVYLINNEYVRREAVQRIPGRCGVVVRVRRVQGCVQQSLVQRTPRPCPRRCTRRLRAASRAGAADAQGSVYPHAAPHLSKQR